MGTAGGLALANRRGLLEGDGPVLVLNGDGVLALDLEPLIDRHRSSDDLVTMCLLPHLDPGRWSRVVVDRGSRVRRIRPAGLPERGEAPFLYPGVMLVSRAALDSLQPTPSEIGDRLWRPALAEGRLGASVVGGHWREVGTPSDYLDVALSQLGEKTSIHATASVAAGATLERVLVGAGTSIGAGSKIFESVVGEGARVSGGTLIRRSVVLGALTVGDGETVEGEFLGSPSSV
jgi:NDP-sugar pyrophosphorylase family protein